MLLTVAGFGIVGKQHVVDQDKYERDERPDIHDGLVPYGQMGDWSHLQWVDMRFINPDYGSFDPSRVWEFGLSHPNTPLPKMKPTGIARGLAFGYASD